MHSLCSTEDPKFFKISLIIEHVSRKFQKSYLAQENVSTDGSVTSWKGRLSFQWNIPLKASKIWYKTYELYQSRTGHLYIQELERMSEQQSVLTTPCKGQKLFSNLYSPSWTWGYTLYTNNTYNSQYFTLNIKKNHGTNIAGTPSPWQGKCTS
jgi:hypothetical protein